MIRRALVQVRTDPAAGTQQLNLRTLWVIGSPDHGERREEADVDVAEASETAGAGG